MLAGMIRLYRPDDAPAVARLSAACSRAEADFVLNPMWETEGELHAEFARHGIAPEEHLLVHDDGAGEILGLSGWLRPSGAHAAGLFCPVVDRSRRGQGLGGELLRAAIDLGKERLGVTLATAGIGTRNRGGYSLLMAHGFRSVRQHFLMRCDTRPKVAANANFAPAPAEADDLAAIQEIYDSCDFPERSLDETRARFEAGHHAYTVAREGDEVVAFTEIETHWPQRNWLAFVGVRPALRDRGLGSGLAAWSVARRFEAGTEQALLLLSPANRTAVRAYEKVGFRRTRIFDVLEKAL